MGQSSTLPPEALPDWLTEEYFRSLFRRKSSGEEVAVQNVTAKLANEDHIHGRRIRESVDVLTPAGAETLCYVLKCPGAGQFTSASACISSMERLVLGESIPAVENGLDAAAPGKFGQLAPRLVDGGFDENPFIMTEDLSVCTGNRQIGLDLEQSLAHLAASVAVMDRFESEMKAVPPEEVQSVDAPSMEGVGSAIGAWGVGGQSAEQVPSRPAQASGRGEGLVVLCDGDPLVEDGVLRVGTFADAAVLRHHWERVGEQDREALNAALGHGARALSQEAVLFCHTPPEYRARLQLPLPRLCALGGLDEFPNTEVNHKIRSPSWVNRNFFQLLLRQQSRGADLGVERVHVSTPERVSTSTTDVLQAAVEAAHPSGVETKSFAVRCPGNVVFNKMPAKPCMLEMETRILGKLISVAEKVSKDAVSGTISSQTRSLVDRRENSRSYMRKRNQVKPIFHHKSSDLKFCLAVVRYLALLQVACMIALDDDNSKISYVARSPVLKEFIRTSIKTIFSHLATQQIEKTEKEKSPSETRDECVLLDSQQAIVKHDEIQFDTEKTTEEQHGEEERKLNAAGTERVRRDSNTTKYRLNECEQRRELEGSKSSNVGRKINKAISCASNANKLNFTTASVVTRGNATELSEESFKNKPRLGALPSENQERREDLQSRLRAHFPVDRISFSRLPPQAFPSEAVGSRRATTSSVRAFQLPRLGHCGLNEQFPSTFHTTSCVYIYT